jgi:hypothetical protein
MWEEPLALQRPKHDARDFSLASFPTAISR